MSAQHLVQESPARSSTRQPIALRGLALLVAAFVAVTGCSLQHIVVRSTGVLIENGFAALNEETDLELAAAGAGASLKLLEGLLRSDPENPELLLTAAQGYVGYALAFVDAGDTLRLTDFYRRGRDYALAAWRAHAAARRTPSPTQDVLLNLGALTGYLDLLDARFVPEVYWAASGWAGMIDANRADPDLLADVPTVVALSEFVVRHDGGYSYAGAHLLLGALAGSVPAFLGGEPDRSRAQFERAIALTDGRFLMTHVLYASTYAVQTQDQSRFRALLEHVLSADPRVLPEQNLANAVARRRASRLLARADELFES